MAQPLIDLTGKTFGEWKVIRQAERMNKLTMWACECSCGKIGEVSSPNLKSGRSLSCGCRPRRRHRRGPPAELVGRRFGRLLVVEKAEKRPPRQFWLCVCDCGGSIKAPTGNLRGGTRSCGCWRRERTAEIGRANRAELRP